MRGAILLLAALGACATPHPPEDPSTLLDLLASDAASRREEGVQRLAIQGQVLGETGPLSGKDLDRLEEDTDTLAAGVTAALEEKDPERTVWRVWHLLRRGCLAREERRVADALARQGFRLVEIYEPHERSKFVRYVARKAAYLNAVGDRHDLFFWVQSTRRDDGGWAVREIYAGLHVVFNAAFKTLATPERYPRGSVLAGFFEMAEVQKLAAVFPLLEEIELTYGRIRDRDSDSAPAGYHVNAGFSLAGEGKGGGRGIYCTAESGLDPSEGRRGRLLREGFVPSDTLGALTLRGNSFWGAGGLKPTDE